MSRIVSRPLVPGALVLVACAACLPVACSSHAKQTPDPRPAMPVVVAKAQKESVPVLLRAIGTVEPINTVAVRAELGGEIFRVHFREGQEVRKGDPLFTLDPRPFQAALEQAEAALARDGAQLGNASEQVRRYKDLVAKDYVTQQQYDDLRANASALEAVVKADRAAIDNARVQLSYCSIRSPIDGRTGKVMVQVGNLVKANDATLVVINRVAPIYVSFSVPERYLPEIRKRAAQESLEVQAAVGQDPGSPESGELTFIDNTVNTSTGTILLRGTFPNADRVLWPGQFVDARLRLAVRPDAVVVPSEAVQTGQQGAYVFVVKPDLTVESRPVEAGEPSGGKTVIEKGVEAGETVVTDGQLRLVPGAKVAIQGGSGAAS